MKTSESIKEIAAALVKAQDDIRFAVKDSTNPHFKSRYADLGSVIVAIKESLNNCGIAFIQMPTESQTGTLALTTRLIHQSGEWIEDTAVCPLQKNDPQGYGSALTYLRRYSLASITGLYQDDDDGESTRMNPEDYLKKIQSATNLTSLQKIYGSIIAEVKNDKNLTNAIIAEKDRLKKIFELDNEEQ